nr:unnamed protein product [Gossypium raimondii]
MPIAIFLPQPQFLNAQKSLFLHGSCFEEFIELHFHATDMFHTRSLLGFSAGDSSIFYFVFRNMCRMEVHEDMYTAVESVEICLVSSPMDETGKRLWEKVKYQLRSCCPGIACTN